MTKRPPLRIGLSARILHEPPAELGFKNRVLQYLEQSVAHWIMSTGALVFMVPTIEAGGSLQRSAVHMSDYVHELDGLVLQGGADVSPTSYGEQPLRPEWRGDRVRDLYEIELLWEFVFQRKPVFGICRGAQLINVAFSGSLYQDIATQLSGSIRHYDRDIYDDLHHEIVIEAGSVLSQLYPELPVTRVNSLHHQAVKELGSGLVVEARSHPDGVIEATRWTGSSHVVGVQWHPEFHRLSSRELLDSTPLLDEFLRKAAERRSG